MQFTCNSTPRTCQCTSGYFSTKPCWVEVRGPEWIRNPVHLILQHKMTFKHSLNSWQDYGVIMNPAAPHTDIVCLATCKHDLTGNRPAHTHKHMWVQRFSGPPVGPRSALPSHLLCWHAGYQCLFQRKLWLLLRLPGKWALLSLASETGLLLHAASDIKESLTRIIWPGSLISASEPFDYSKWNHYYYISGSNGMCFPPTPAVLHY